jgi:hypothetical protein
MDSVFVYTISVAVLYAILSVIRNRFNKSDPKSSRDIAVESMVAGLATFSSYYLLNSLGYATISSVQKGGSTAAFVSKPEF